MNTQPGDEGTNLNSTNKSEIAMLALNMLILPKIFMRYVLHTSSSDTHTHVVHHYFNWPTDDYERVAGSATWSSGEIDHEE